MIVGLELGAEIFRVSPGAVLDGSFIPPEEFRLSTDLAEAGGGDAEAGTAGGKRAKVNGIFS